jgi:hypothetical protein
MKGLGKTEGRSIMHSNFDSRLKIVDGVVKAGGELGWDSGDTEALVAVTIIQMDEKLMGTASSPPKFPPWKPKWVLDVKPTDRQKKFQQGPAQALGVAFTINAGKPRLFRWTRKVRLEN